jgi:uncharacterized membrane protein
MAQVRIRIVKLPRWQLILIGIVALALLAALFVLALGFFLLIVLPAALIAGVLLYLFGFRRAAGAGPGKGQTIETEYRVLDRDKIERERK